MNMLHSFSFFAANEYASFTDSIPFTDYMMIFLFQLEWKSRIQHVWASTCFIKYVGLLLGPFSMVKKHACLGDSREPAAFSTWNAWGGSGTPDRYGYPLFVLVDHGALINYTWCYCYMDGTQVASPNDEGRWSLAKSMVLLPCYDLARVLCSGWNCSPAPFLASLVLPLVSYSLRPICVFYTM